VIGGTRVSESEMNRRRDQGGAVAVELALVFPILALVLFGIIQWGITFSQYEVFVNASREGARTAAVRGDNTSVRNAVTQHAAGYTLSTTPVIQVDESGTWVTIADPGPACTSDSQGESVSVAWDQDFSVSIPFFKSFTTTAHIQGVFRCE